jgi:hypothetical protein
LSAEELLKAEKLIHAMYTHKGNQSDNLYDDITTQPEVIKNESSLSKIAADLGRYNYIKLLL